MDERDRLVCTRRKTNRDSPKVTRRRPPSKGRIPELSEYELRYLIAHLRCAGRLSSIDDLLSVLCADGANFWFAEKDRRGDQEGYSNDLRTALDAAIESLHRADGADIGVLTGSIVRYSICLATLNEFAETISTGVLKELVRRKL